MNPEHPNQSPLLDPVQHQMMADALGEAFNAVAGEFFNECRRFATGLAEAAESGDASGFRELCHEIKGASALLGFSGISTCAAEWETMAKDGQVPDPGSVRERFPCLVEDTRKHVEETP